MKTPKHILVIRLSAMGDVAMTVPVLRVLLLKYPDVRITVVSRNFFKPLFNDLPNTSFLEADVYGEHKGLGLIKLAKEGKAKGVDAVADLHNVIRSKLVSNYLRMAGLKVQTLDKGRASKKKLVNAKGGAIYPLKSMHERYADVFRKLGFELDLADFNAPQRQQLNPRLHNIIGTEPKKIIGIAPFAAYESKMYPLDSMKSVIAKLDATEKYKILLFGGGKDEEEILHSWESEHKSVTSIAGALTFEEELALISNIDLMIAMDSGNGHLAANYGIPVITLWGVTHPFAGFQPFGQPNDHQLLSNRDEYPLIPTSVYGNKYPAGYENVMRSISQEQLMDEIFKIL